MNTVIYLQNRIDVITMTEVKRHSRLISLSIHGDDNFRRNSCSNYLIMA